MIVSVTEVASYKRCRRQWTINSRNRWGLTRLVPSRPLGLGTLVHAALGDWLELYKKGESMPEQGLAYLFLGHAQEAIDEAKSIYARQTGAVLSDSELAPYMEIIQMGFSMMNNYQKRWGRPVPDDFEVVSTEQRFQVPIPGTLHDREWVWEPADAGASSDIPQVRSKGWMVERVLDQPGYHYLEGRLDGILQRRADGKLFTLEHKTYGQRPREDVLFAQDQFMGYHWGLLQLAAEMDLDPALVAGVAYDGLWKRAAPPKSVDGHIGTLQDLFARRLITRPAQEIIEYEAFLAQIVTEMANNPFPYINRTSDGSCFWACSDNQLCLGMSRGEDTDHRLRTEYRVKPPDEEDEKDRG